MTASARGLFRATGKASKPVAVANGSDLGGDFTRAEHLLREKDDFYPTPPEPTLAFLSVEGDRLRDFPAIWEPAAGDGAMAREMASLGFKVHLSDLVDRGCGATVQTFYDFTAPLATAIVTNPPFQECGRDAPWVRHARSLGVEYMALLLPLQWPGAMERAAIWQAWPPARVYLMRWRIDFTGQGAPPMLNAWFVWDSQHEGETVLRMLDRTDARQLSLIGAA